jgi:hypothetical protein
MVTGRGWSYGNEFSVSKTKGRLTGSLSYTLSWAKRQFDEKNYGNVYYANFDRRHYISLNADYPINKRWSVDAGWIFASGNPVSLPVERMWLDNLYPYTSGFLVIYGNKNNFRLPPFNHLDVAFKYKLKSKRNEKDITFGLYNIYNRQNTYYLHLKSTQNAGIIIHAVSLLPIIPFLSYNFIIR